MLVAILPLIGSERSERTRGIHVNERKIITRIIWLTDTRRLRENIYLRWSKNLLHIGIDGLWRLEAKKHHHIAVDFTPRVMRKWCNTSVSCQIKRSSKLININSQLHSIVSRRSWVFHCKTIYVQGVKVIIQPVYSSVYSHKTNLIWQNLRT